MSASAPDSPIVDRVVERVAGRVVITARAMEAVFSALAASELGSSPRSIRVRVRDDGGLLSAAVRAPVDATDGGPSVLERVESARARIRTTGAAITGATLSDVTVRVTDITSANERRVS